MDAETRGFVVTANDLGPVAGGQFLLHPRSKLHGTLAVRIVRPSFAECSTWIACWFPSKSHHGAVVYAPFVARPFRT